MNDKDNGDDCVNYDPMILIIKKVITIIILYLL